MTIRKVEAVELGEALTAPGNEAACKAIDELLLALALGDKQSLNSCLANLMGFAIATHYELSGQKAHDEWEAQQEQNDFEDSVRWAGLK